MKTKNIVKLVVFPNFNTKKWEKENGTYLLFLPQGNTILWGHLCSSSGWAMKDLCYNNSRLQVLNELFGEGNWEFVLFTNEYETEQKFYDYLAKINKGNPQIDLSLIAKIKQKYLDQGGCL